MIEDLVNPNPLVIDKKSQIKNNEDLNGIASKTGIERLLESIDSIAPNHLASLLHAIANRFSLEVNYA